MLLDRPFFAPLLIGRERELHAIAALLDQGAGTLLISGEAGIGKSRLVREALANATARGVRISRVPASSAITPCPTPPFSISGAPSPRRIRTRPGTATGTAPGLLRLLPELSATPVAAPTTSARSRNSDVSFMRWPRSSPRWPRNVLDSWC